jgi:hypothetical protein
MTPADCASELLRLFGGFDRAQRWIIAAELASEVQEIDDRCHQLAVDVTKAEAVYANDDREVVAQMREGWLMALGKLSLQLGEARADLERTMRHAALAACFGKLSLLARASQATQEIDHDVQNRS